MKKLFVFGIACLLALILSNYPINVTMADNGGYCGSLNSDPGDSWCVKTSANYCCIGGGGPNY
ncbi:MAG: hypothetical protein ACK4S0_15070 [Sediminibacterium sp.]